jgi:integrase
MAKVFFLLNNPKPDKLTSILAQLYISREIRPTLATGEHCKPENWNGSRVTPASKGYPTKGDAANINRHLAKIEADLMEVWRDNKGAGREEIKAKAFEAINGSETVQKKTVETWIEGFIKESKNKAATVQVYRATLDHLKNYAKKEKITLTWETFTLDFYEDFTKYLYEDLKHNDNTVGKYVRKVKKFLQESFDRDLHTNLNFKKKSFRAPSAEVDEVYLNEDEIIKIYNLKLPELEQSKKRFVFDCWVGLRYGDLSKINPNNVTKGLSGGKMLKVTTEKTGEDVMIPLHPLAEEIWNSWGGRPPKPIANPTFNEHVKTLAAAAELDSLVQRRNTIKGQVTVEWVPKHEMVKAHTARRSFATNCYLMGIATRTIMAVTGHRTEKAFMKYIRVSKEEHANKMAEAFKAHTEKQQSLMQVNKEASGK